MRGSVKRFRVQLVERPPRATVVLKAAATCPDCGRTSVSVVEDRFGRPTWDKHRMLNGHATCMTSGEPAWEEDWI